MRAIVRSGVAGFVASRLAWAAARPLFAAPALARPNYRGHVLPTSAGVLLPAVAAVVAATRPPVGFRSAGTSTMARADQKSASGLTLLAATGFGLLGLVDDVAGSGDDRGFRGHLRALGRGRLTTGGLKLVGGAAVAAAAVRPVARTSTPRLAADAALVALAANLGNLLDRAPGRTVKAGVAAFTLLAVGTGWDPALATAAAVVGAALGLLPDDLHERLMLGDAGANALGAVLGLAAVLACTPATRTVALAAVAALNLAAEAVSFSRVIDAVPPLRALDRLGRLPAPAP